MVERIAQPRPKVNVATTSPVVTDDVSKGYQYFSQWYNSVTGELFTCVNPAVGAAVWNEGGGGGGGVHIAAVDPTVTDDNTKGYDPGEMWLNSVTHRLFQCISNATGAAVWRDRTALTYYNYLVGPAGVAKFQTIQAAIDQAVTDGGWTSTNQAIIGIFDGTYIENLTLSPWVNLAAVSLVPKQPQIYKLAERVKIVGTIAYPVSSGSVNDVSFFGIHVAPTTGAAFAFTGGNAGKRIWLVECDVDGSPDSNTITAVTNTSNTIIAALETTIASESGFVAWELPVKQILVVENGLVSNSDVGSGGVAVRLAGGTFKCSSRPNFLGSAGSIRGIVEVKTGTTGSKLVLDSAHFWRAGGVADVVVDGTLNTDSFFHDCLAATFSGSAPRDITIGGANATQFREAPFATEGDVRQYIDNRWQNSAGVRSRASLDNKDMTARNTTGDGQLGVNQAIVGVPSADGYVTVVVGAEEISVADGPGEQATKGSYFSGDGGTTARAVVDIQAGDMWYFNQSVAGFPLSTSDRVNFHYEVAV